MRSNWHTNMQEDRLFNLIPVDDLLLEPVVDIINGPSCIIARSTETDNIVGIRTGHIVSRADKQKKMPNFAWIARLPKFFRVHPLLVFGANSLIMMNDVHYGAGKDLMFKQCEDAEMIYHCFVLSVGAEAQGKGLGTELIKRGYTLAKKVNSVINKGRGCDSISFFKKIHMIPTL